MIGPWRAALGAALLLCGAGAARAEGGLELDCGARTAVERVLTGMGQVLVFDGLQATGDRLLIYADPRGGAWTAVVALPDPPPALCLLTTGAAGRLHLTFLPES